MSAAAAQTIIPATLAERLATEEVFRVPASLESYVAFAEQCEYRVEYSNGHIISMGSPTDTHELICGNAIRILGNILEGDERFAVYGSNLATLSLN